MSDGANGARGRGGGGDGDGDGGGENPARLAGRRSQLVLVAAGVATTEPTAITPTEDARQAIERAAFDASTELQGVRSWSERDAVASDVAARFDARVNSIETDSLEREIAHTVARNQSAAADWASANCPGGPDRQFGACEAQEGLVLQERGGDTHVVAIAVDLRTVAEDSVYDGTYVLDAEVGGRRSR